MTEPNDELSKLYDESRGAAQGVFRAARNPYSVQNYIDHVFRGNAERVDQDRGVVGWVEAMGAIANNEMPGGQYIQNPLLIREDIREGRFYENEIRGFRDAASSAVNTLFGVDFRRKDDPRDALLQEYNPLDDPDFQGLSPEDKWRILDSPDKTAANRAIFDLENEKRNRALLENVGFGRQLVMSIALSGLDPTTYVEIMASGGAASFAAGSRAIASIGSTRIGNTVVGAIGGAAAAGGQQALIEEGLDDRLLLRTDQERRASILGAFALGGVLGGGIGFLTKDQRIANQLEIMGVGPDNELLHAKVMEKLPANATDKQYADAVQAVLREAGGSQMAARFGARIPIVGRLSPDLRATTNIHTTSQLHANMISSNAAVSTTKKAEVLTKTGLDAVKKRMGSELKAATHNARQIHAKSGSKLRRRQFNQLVGQVLRVGDVIPPQLLTDPNSAFSGLSKVDVQAINDAAKVYRVQFQKLERLAAEVGMLDKWRGRVALADVENGVASYFTRVYDQGLVRMERRKAEKLVKAWFERNGDEYEIIDVERTVNHMMNARDGGGASDAALTSPVMERALTMPDDFSTVVDGEKISLQDFLIDDVEFVTDYLAERMIPKLAMAQRMQGTRAQRTMRLMDTAENLQKRAELMDETDPGSTKRLIDDFNDISDATHDNAVVRGLENGYGADPGVVVNNVKTYRILAAERRELGREISSAIKKINRLELTDAPLEEVAEARRKLGDLENDRRAVQAKIDPLERTATSGLKENVDLADIDLTRRPNKLDPTATQEDILTFSRKIQDRITLERRSEFAESVGMGRWMRQIEAENKRLVDGAKSEAEKRRIVKRLQSSQDDIEAVHMRYMGLNPHNQNPTDAISVGSKALRTWNLFTSMGSSAVAQAPDAAVGLLVNGLTNVMAASVGQLRRFSDILPSQFTKGRAEEMMYGLEVVSSMSRIDAIAGTELSYATTMSQKAGQALKRGFRHVSFLDWMNSRMKAFAATQVQMNMIRTIRKVAADKKLNRKDEIFLRSVGINRDTAKRMAAQLEQHVQSERMPITKRPYEWARVDQWADFKLAEQWKDAMFQGVENVVVTPGSGDLPRSFDSTLGKLLFQFRSFSVAAHQRITVAGLGNSGTRAASYLVGSTFFGGLVTVLGNYLAGRETDWDDIPGLTLNAVDRAGSIALVMEANGMVEAIPGAGLSALVGAEQDLHRFSSRNTVDQALGATPGKLADIASAVSLPFREAQYGDQTSVRRLIPYQNGIWIRSILDKLAGPLMFGEWADPKFERNIRLGEEF